MKSRIWITSLFASILIIGGCSSSKSEPDDNMDHSNMSHDDMKMEEADSQTENGHMSHTNPLALTDSIGENELALPALLEPEKEKGNVYNIVAQKGTVEFFDGYQTETLGYNGSFLGPVIRVNRGDTVKFRTVNDLSEETTFHWHGLDLPGEGDGGPHKSIKPGKSEIVEFTVDQQAATLWFHPHPEGKTSEQFYKGLAGLIYVEDENSKNLGLPSDYGVNDIPLIFQDRQFDGGKQLNYQRFKNDDGTIGDTLLVNGTLNPKLTISKEKVRLRLLNGSNARNYTFKLNTGDSFEQIATDGGFLNTPETMNEITLTPGERAEVIVDFSKYDATSNVALINEDNTILLPFKINEVGTETSDMPQNMNDFAVTDEERSLPVSKKLELFGMGNMVTINGKRFDMNRIDFTQKQSETEIWEIYNKPDMMGGMVHPFHIHGTQFKIVSIDGKEPPVNEQGWKDTIAIEPGETFKLAIKFNNKGIYMYHCHILEHEDNGMMGQVLVE
ncbi:multicopper oxidase family protein [Lysinibacillus sp. NPDC097287]|uniref:multicopper oxidase family protein n=1 Tax=Lysinibacillus sp. NPDC097287 TaxID=3364144 RepID=UPI0038269F66